MERDPSFVSNWDNVVSDGRNDLVFEDKNKEYGAYVIRKKYNSSLLIGILVSVFILTLAVVIPLINTLWDQTEDIAPQEEVVVISNLEDLMPKEKVLPLEAPPPPPPIMERIKFTIVEVTEEEVEEPPVTQEKLEDKKVGETTEKGDPDATDLPDIVESNDLIGAGEDNTIYTHVEQEAIYPGGGLRKIWEYVYNNYNQDLYEQFPDVTGEILVTFVVNKKGEISDVRISKGLNNRVLENEAIKVVKSLPGKWIPGKNNGKAVDSYYSVPIKFE